MDYALQFRFRAGFRAREAPFGRDTSFVEYLGARTAQYRFFSVCLALSALRRVSVRAVGGPRSINPGTFRACSQSYAPPHQAWPPALNQRIASTDMRADTGATGNAVRASARRATMHSAAAASSKPFTATPPAPSRRQLAARSTTAHAAISCPLPAQTPKQRSPQHAERPPQKGDVTLVRQTAQAVDSSSGSAATAKQVADVYAHTAPQCAPSRPVHTSLGAACPSCFLDPCARFGSWQPIRYTQCWPT